MGREAERPLEWDVLKAEVKQHGVRNSLYWCPPPAPRDPGNNECFEPYTSNIYTRRVLSGEFIVVNKYLLRDLVKLGLWSEELKNKIIASNGSVANIPEIPQNLKELYKTAWEISQKTIVDMAADRGAFICQSQSLNVFMENANFGKLTSLHFHAWKSGLKTGMYYLRTKAATDAIKFTLDKSRSMNQRPRGQEPVLTAPTPRACIRGEMAAQRSHHERAAMTAEERAATEIACGLVIRITARCAWVGFDANRRRRAHGSVTRRLFRTKNTAVWNMRESVQSTAGTYRA